MTINSRGLKQATRANLNHQSTVELLLEPLSSSNVVVVYSECVKIVFCKFFFGGGATKKDFPSCLASIVLVRQHHSVYCCIILKRDSSTFELNFNFKFIT